MDGPGRARPRRAEALFAVTGGANRKDFNHEIRQKTQFGPTQHSPHAPKLQFEALLKYRCRQAICAS
jgi:hypothetical protein